MAVDGHITLPNGVWTQLGAADITKFTLLHVSGRDVLFRGVAGNAPPLNTITTGMRLAGGSKQVDAARSGLVAKTLFDLTPRGNATRLFARPDGVGVSRVYFANDTDFEADMAVVEAIDVLAAAGINIDLGDMAVTEAIDVLAATGINIDLGDMAVTEVIDTLAATGININFGAFAVAEAIDVLAAVGININFGAFAVVEVIDTLAATGDTRIDGDMGVTEVIDVLAADGAVSG